MKILYGILWVIMKSFLLIIMILLVPIYLITMIWEGIAKEIKEEQLMKDLNDL